MPKKELKVQFSSTSFVGRKIQGHFEKGNNKESWYSLPMAALTTSNILISMELKLFC